MSGRFFDFEWAGFFLPSSWRADASVVPVVELCGTIGITKSFFQSALSLSGVEKVLEKAFSVRGAVSVAVVVNSPGGSPVQSHLIFKRIRALSIKKGLPVYVFCEDAAASGGYLIALAGDEIYADPSSIVGSIGVVSSFFGLDRMIEKIGVERRIYTSGENKAMLDMFQPEKAGDVKHLKIIQKEMHETFKEIVLERRGSKLNASSLEENLDLFSGAFWTGSTAVELGLVDHLGDLHGVLKEKYGDTLVLRPMSSGEGWVKRCFRSSVSLFGGAIDSLESRALWGRLGL